MLHTRFVLSVDSVVAWISGNFLLETGAVSEF